MLHGVLNTDRLCKVLEQIFTQRDSNVEVLVKVIFVEEGTESKRMTTSFPDQSALDEL